MDLRGANYNTDAQVRGLERLLQRIPKQTAEAEPAPEQPKMRTAKRLNAEETAQLIAGYQTAAGMRPLGIQFGIHPATVSLILRRNGVKLRPKGPSSDQVIEAARLYHSGWSSARIGEQLGFNGTTIVRTLRKHGVTIRDTQGRAH